MNARFSFTEQELKCLLYAVSKIKPHDTIDQEYTYDFQSFYSFFPGQKDPHAAFKTTLLALDQKNWWRETAPGVECSAKFFKEIKLDHSSESVSFKFDETVISHYLLPASRYGLEFMISFLFSFSQMKCQYSINLCIRLMIGYCIEGLNTQVIEIMEFKKLMSCQQYENYNDLVKRVIVPTLKEINQYMFFNVDYDTEKKGKKVTHLIFRVTMKNKFWKSHPFDPCNEVFSLIESYNLK